MTFLKSLVAGFIVLAVAMLARPILIRALRINLAGAGSGSPAPAARPSAIGGPRGPLGLPARSRPGDEPDDLVDAVIDVRRIDGKINAASARRLAQLLDRHPDLAAQAVRRWLAQGPESR